MDRKKSRKEHESRRLTCVGSDFPINGRDFIYNEKSKYKRHDKKKYDMSQNSYILDWPPQPRFYPMTQRQFLAPDSSACRYSVPLSFSFEPVNLPVYPALFHQGNCSVPLDIENRSHREKHHKAFKKNKQSKANSIENNEVPAIFSTPRVNNGDQPDYMSLPPVNCDIYTAKTSDTEAAYKRRFSDPGIGQMSSDDCSSSRSESSADSEPTDQVHDFFSLVDQVNMLKENNSYLSKELYETKLELEALKMQSQTWKSNDYKPGALSDAISEIRTAAKLGEEALISKVTLMLEQNSIECKEAQEKLEEKLKQEMNDRLSKLEEQITKTSQHETTPETVTHRDIEKSHNPTLDQQIVDLEEETIHLRKELQEAVAKRKIAEATTEKLERLVGILRKKVNGVSHEFSITDDKHILVRPLASSLEKNPFIIANNRQGQKYDTLPFSKSKIQPFRAFPLENSEGIITTVSDNKENESAESVVENGSSSGSHSNPSSETPSVTAQVTITGPVTDL